MSRSLIPLLVLLVGLSCLVEARFLPDKPHRTYVRRRPSPTDPDLEIIEVRKVYYERRPKKKVMAPLDEDELDWRIRCDFDPSLMECRGVAPASSTRPPTTTTSTTTTSTSTTTTSTTTTTPRPSTTSTTVAPLDEESWDCDSDPTQEKCAPSTSSSSTTTASGLLPELPEEETPVEEEDDDDEEEKATIPKSEDEDYMEIDADDLWEDDVPEDDDTNAESGGGSIDINDELNGGSIGDNDQSAFEKFSSNSGDDMPGIFT